MPDQTALIRLATQAYSTLSDGVLLERFVTDRDESAFAAVVERYGAIVLDAARAILRHTQDAEDVFQAAFLVLARKAATIRHTTSIGCWLHGVARRIALKVLRARSRRTRHEAAHTHEPPSGEDLTWGEVRQIVHDELARLPETLRAVVLLCYLEGLTQEEAATQLGIPKGTLRGRLERAREILRHRLARRGLALTVLACSAPLTRAIPPLLVLDTAREAKQFAAGVAVTSHASKLAQGAMSTMTTTRLALCLLCVLLAGIGLAAVLAPPDNPQEQPARNGNPPALAPAPVLKKDAPKAEFEEVTIIIKHYGLSNWPPETIRIAADGTCTYEVTLVRMKPPPPPLVHKLSPEKVQKLNELLKKTDWLTKPVEKHAPEMHSSDYSLTLKKDGEKCVLTIPGDQTAYKDLLRFFNSTARQEDLVNRLESSDPDVRSRARVDLDALPAATLAMYDIDLARYKDWATKLIRNPEKQHNDDLWTAVRLVTRLKLESERDALNALATHRDYRLRAEVAQAIGVLGGEKAIPVLRKMLPDTNEAAWELVKLGKDALPTIVEAIREGTDPRDITYEQLIRAYIDHWKEVPKPLDPKLVEAIQQNMAAPDVKAFRTVYHKELLKLNASVDKN
jgi:RNA polymerase sigma factor (sigma-70 family)